MFTTSSGRYSYHIRQAEQARATIKMYKRFLGSRKSGDTYNMYRNCINGRINEHRMALTAAKIERETHHYTAI